MNTAKIHSIYNHQKSKGIDFTDSPSLTKQASKEECDVNNILAKYQKTGVLTHVRQSAAQYGDFSEVESLQETLQKLHDAEDAFMALPAKVRREFDNDPMAFVEACGDPEQLPRLVELGLAIKHDTSQPHASHGNIESPLAPEALSKPSKATKTGQGKPDAE